MKIIEMNVGKADVISEFFSEVALAPRQIKELVLVSPFVQVSAKRSKSGTRLCQIIRNVNSCGGSAVLISDDTPSRRYDFQKAILRYPDLAGKLFVRKALHAKCGFARNAVGNQIAFLGSANLTDAGLNTNAEIVFGLRGKAFGGQGWHLVGQLRLMIAQILSDSFALTNN